MSKQIVQLNEQVIKTELKELVRQSVQEVLNGFLDAEADRLTNASKYERTEGRRDTRAGHYSRKLLTGAGEIELEMPKLRTLTFETAIIERYKRREASIEEALVEMYLAGVSTRRVEDITEILWNARLSAGTMSRLNGKVYEQIEAWRQRPLDGSYPYVYLDGIYLKRNWGGEYGNVAILVAMAVNERGEREVIGAAEGMKEDKSSWLAFLRHLKERGLKGTQLFVGDKCLGLIESLAEVYPQACYQRCMVHFYRNIFSVVPRGKVKEVAAMLKAIHAQEDKPAAMKKIGDVVEKLKEMKLFEAARKVESAAPETLVYMDFPREHWRRIRSNNAMERLNREIRRRTKSIGAFPEGQSALMLVCARLRHMEQSEWGSKTYLNMQLLEDCLPS
ncbi:MAG TPA: IS256 family transposase [Anaerolineaceae bacterium]|jgi:transposase-like protein|nr:IS256 family transposase [Chloroflexota bacterium]HOT26047.1 IS256 family transposase [Anaerolineaceae bacterium]HOZ38609.1 IS256 family transposase [Anaerolineaceae bacterium]HQH58273.1 IS256 family transposase [Anaerolineaceae bacterium]HQK02714.1 IS256 family transposase [Anaerolineaceae bacterium]